MTPRPFAFMFEVSNEFLRLAPDDAARFIHAYKQQWAEQEFAEGPRGGTYRLVTPPEEWESTDLSDYYFNYGRSVTGFRSRRQGVYVPPKRGGGKFIPKRSFRTFTLTVRDGKAIRPNGATIETTSKYVDIPVEVAA